jgi:uncharacterized membrane protein YadS
MQPHHAPTVATGRWLLLPGLAAAALAVAVAFGAHVVLPAIPLLTASVALGIIVAQVPAMRFWLDGVLAPGLRFAARTLMRAGIVLLGAPLVAGVGLVLRRRDRLGAIAVDVAARRPPIVPLFVAGFLVAVLLRSFLPLPPVVLDTADAVQTILLAAALFGLGAAVRFGTLVRTGGRALAVGLLSWVLIAALALAAVHL